MKSSKIDMKLSNLLFNYLLDICHKDYKNIKVLVNIKKRGLDKFYIRYKYTEHRNVKKNKKNEYKTRKEIRTNK